MMGEGSKPITLGELIEKLHATGPDGKSLSDHMQEAMESYSNEADAFWDALPYEDKLKAFHAVCKRIHKGDVIDRGSYRHVLYNVFGFDFDAYSLGMNCGYLDIHNYIITPKDQESINEQHKIAQYIVGSEQFMWLMAGSNHVQTQIQEIRPAYEKWKEAGGVNELKKET